MAKRESAAARRIGLGALAALIATAAAPAAHAGSYTLFESGQVRPLALSPDGALLFAANTPDNRLEIFRIAGRGLDHLASVAVGLEPVAVAARSQDEVWVVNHLSDSVSLVDVSDPRRPQVRRTLLVGDEPRDLVFAGPGRARAFITTAHRGQNSPIDPELRTPGVGRADVWVFDADHLGDTTLGGDPETIIVLFSDTPRALAVSPDGATVYAAGFHSGNRTTTIHDSLVPNGGEAVGGVPGPNTSFDGTPQPEVTVMLQHDGTSWRDVLGRSWDEEVRFSLPDNDVFVIDAAASPPAQVTGPAGFYAGVGTTLFNMAVHPGSGKVFVSNLEALNMRRFSGPGIYAGETARGRFHQDRISILGPGGTVTPRHLNKHIDFDQCCAPVPNPENARSLALPLEMAFSADGATLYVAAMGSDAVGVFDTRALETDAFVPSAADHIPVSGGGPSGLVVDHRRGLLFVLTRFDDGISIIDTRARREIGHQPMYSPEPEHIVGGRRFLYDAARGSSHGDSACASCHLFGDLDSLAWDLGNPDGGMIHNPNPFIGLPVLLPTADFFPMKGPMTTQSLRGLANHGPMHWRGDRTGGNDAPNQQPDSGAFDEEAAFMQFQQTFVDVNGRDGFIPDQDMRAFTRFILENHYPPNPLRNLDNSLTAEQQAGHDLFFYGPRFDLTNRCGECHVVDPTFNPGSAAPGLFGTAGLSSFVFVSQTLKVPQLRNLYQKVGMFGMASTDQFVPGNNEFLGDQVRGFGFIHDGSVDTVFRFHSIIGFAQSPFNPEGFPPGPEGDLMRRQLEAFLMVFPSNLAPIVGQQVTLGADNAAAAGARVDLLIARAEAGECDLVGKTRLGGLELGLLYLGAGAFLTDHSSLPLLPDFLVRTLAAFASEVTYTCAPPGAGRRMGVDRDEDGVLDGDEPT